MTRILIVAAYASVRAGLHALLDGVGDLEIVGHASGSAELTRLLPEANAEVVLADDLPDDREHLLALLAGGEIGLVLLGEVQDGWARLAAAPLPGWAYLLNTADGAQIAASVRAAAAGLIVLDSSLSLPTLPGQSPQGSEAGEALTTREREVLGLVADGLPNKQIAGRLGISLHTVKFHVAAILAKLGASSRTEAVTLGARRGDVSF